MAPTGEGTGRQPAERLQAAVRHRGRRPDLALVDAYDDPTAEADLAIYRAAYGLSLQHRGAGCFKKVNQDGAAARCRRAAPGWDDGESLDLDMVSAICPHCHILLVEANNSERCRPGHGREQGGDPGRQVRLQQLRRRRSTRATPRSTPYYNHPGVAVTALRGDAATASRTRRPRRYVARSAAPP